MWHEARKQERKIRVMMVDYQKRADRRRQFYEKIKLDPTQFVRVYGRPVKIHLDTAVAMAAEGPQIMQPWQGNTDVMIDRYDVRTHMDYIPEVPLSTRTTVSDEEESRCCYERYRILVQNECAGVTEDQCLNQIFLDEQFGAVETPLAKKAEEEKKRLAEKKAAIGYTYEDSTPVDPLDEDEESSDEEIDLDNILDIDALTDEQEQVLNNISLEYGMQGMDYAECLQLDRDEVEALRQARQLEEEKAQYSGRKSRRERRAFKEKRMKNRPPSPPSYAAKEAPKKTSLMKALSSSRSRSKSPALPSAGVVEFITSFGGDSDNDGMVHGPALPPPQMHKKVSSSRSYRSRSRDRSSDRHRSTSDVRSHSRTNSRSSQFSSSRRDSRTSSRKRSRSRSLDPKSRRRSERSRSRDLRSRHRSERSRSREYSRSELDRHYDRPGQRDYSYSSHSRRTSRDRGYEADRHSRSTVRGSADRKYSSSRSARRSSRSRSKSQPRGASRSKNTRSRSSSSLRDDNRPPSPPPIKSYRRPSLSSKSSSDFSSDEESATKSSSAGAINKDNLDDRSQDSTGNRSEMNKSMMGKVEFSSTKGLLTPQERLKKKMQIVLSRQLKADKRAQKEKEEKEEQIRLDREEELRVIALQMRQRERERRHRQREDSEVDSKEIGSNNEDDDDRPSRYRQRRRSSSRSRSPRGYREKRRRSRSSSPRIPRLVDY